MKKLNALTILAFSIMSVYCAPQAYSGITEVHMAHVGTSYPKDYHGVLFARLQQDRSGTIHEFAFRDHDGDEKTFTADEVRQGVVLIRAFGREIVRITGHDFTSESGGPMTITFLRRFFGTDRRQVSFEFIKGSSLESDWRLQTSDVLGRDLFDGIFVKVYTQAGLPKGVEKVFLRNGDRSVREIDPKDLQPGVR